MDRETEAAREWLALVNGRDATEWYRGLLVDAMMHVEALCDRVEAQERRIEELETENEKLRADHVCKRFELDGPLSASCPTCGKSFVG